MQLITHRYTTMLVVAAASHAKIIRIDAKDMAFDPESVTAEVNDVLEFHFLPHNHSVALGDFENPCKLAKSGGFFSGFWPATEGENGKTFQVVVNDTNPFPFYCTVNGHCQFGMSGIVNPTESSSLEDYKKRSADVQQAESPAEVYGGTLGGGGSDTTQSASASTIPSQTSTGLSPPSTSIPGVGGTVKVSWAIATLFGAFSLVCLL